MAVQGLRDNDNKPFIVAKSGLIRRVTFAKDTGRASADIERYTVVTRNPSTGLWWAYTDVDAVDGTQWPRGIVMETIDGTAINAANVTDVAVLKGDAIYDLDQLVLENSLAITDIINFNDDNDDDNQINVTIEDVLEDHQLWANDNIDISELAGLNV